MSKLTVYKLILTVFGVLLTVEGCGPKNSAPSFLKIVDGKEDTINLFPSVVPMFSVPSFPNQYSSCTGTIIGRRSILTAAHCVQPMTWYKVSGQISATSLLLKTYLNSNQVWAYDVAVIQFDRPLSGAPSAVSLSTPKKGQQFTVVGYGRTDPQHITSSGKRFFGKNTIDYVIADQTLKNDTLSLGYGVHELDFSDQTDNNATTAKGDSGGPLYVNGVIIGVTSGTDDRVFYASSFANRYVVTLLKAAKKLDDSISFADQDLTLWKNTKTVDDDVVTVRNPNL